MIHMILIKIGGSVLENIENIVKDMPREDICIVHGGAKIVTEIAEKMGIKQRFIVSPSGIRSRYTDRDTINVFQMVIAGKINKDIVRMLLKHGRKAIGLCGIDNSIIIAERKKHLIVVEEGRKRLIEGGYTGRIKKIDIEFIENLVSRKIVPVIASLAISEKFEPLNINADALAVRIASNIDSCNKIIFLTDVDGVLDENGNTIPRILLSEISEINVGYGMRRKLFEISRSNVEKIFIINGLYGKPFSKMVGTVIINDRR